MKSGIKFEEIEKGKGREAQENDYVLVECLFFLNHGEPIEIFGNFHDNKFVINLNTRDIIPGLRYGIIGMSEGGVRNLKISPHLAYGEKGIVNKIPPNALLLCKVKLLKIVDEHYSLPDPFLRSRQAVITHGGEAVNKKPKWTFGIINDGEYELTVKHPIPGMTWRHTRNRNFKGNFAKQEMDQIFAELQNFPMSFPMEVVAYDNVWADMSEKAGNTPRDRRSNGLCLHVSLFEKDKLNTSYYVTEENSKFCDLKLSKYIYELLAREELK